MEFSIKFILIVALLSIFYQDLKAREVYWFLFPIVGICAGMLHFQSVSPSVFISHSLINVVLIVFLLAVVFLYSKFKLKTAMRYTFGLGDILLCIALAFSFASVSFTILLVFGLITALILHLIVKKTTHTTVPLAGYLASFFTLVYASYWCGFIDNLYAF